MAKIFGSMQVPLQLLVGDLNEWKEDKSSFKIQPGFTFIDFSFINVSNRQFLTL